MSYRVFNPQEYPLPYIIDDISQWPIAKLTADSEAFTAAVQKAVLDKLGVETRTAAAGLALRVLAADGASQ